MAHGAGVHLGVVHGAGAHLGEDSGVELFINDLRLFWESTSSVVILLRILILTMYFCLIDIYIFFWVSYNVHSKHSCNFS